MIKAISKITLYVNDVESAKYFWTMRMGFVIRAEFPMGESQVWLEVSPSKDSETTFVLYDRNLMKEQKKDANTKHPSLILSCADIKETHQQLCDAGVKITDVQIYPFASMCNFFDQDDQEYMLREE